MTAQDGGPVALTDEGQIVEVGCPAVVDVAVKATARLMTQSAACWRAVLRSLVPKIACP
jgi:hypothetical protein